MVLRPLNSSMLALTCKTDHSDSVSAFWSLFLMIYRMSLTGMLVEGPTVSKLVRVYIHRRFRGFNNCTSGLNSYLRILTFLHAISQFVFIFSCCLLSTVFRCLCSCKYDMDYPVIEVSSVKGTQQIRCLLRPPEDKHIYFLKRCVF
jgi:hypothetical protein